MVKVYLKDQYLCMSIFLSYIIGPTVAKIRSNLGRALNRPRSEP